MLRSKSISFLFTLAVPFAVALSPALASAEPPAADAPAEAPEAARTTLSAAFQRYVLAPSGRPMGLLLDGGTFVRTPHHALNRDAPQLKAGDMLEVEGVALKTETGVHVARAVVKQNGVVIADASQLRHRHHDKGREDHAAGHERHHVELQDMSGAGKIASVISSPRGRVFAVVLEDGTTAWAAASGARPQGRRPRLRSRARAARTRRASRSGSRRSRSPTAQTRSCRRTRAARAGRRQERPS